MKKILISGLLSSAVLMAIPANDDRFNGNAPVEEVSGAATCEDATLISINNKDRVIEDDPALGTLANYSRKLDTYARISLPSSTSHQGTALNYGWFSFEIPTESKVTVERSKYGTAGTPSNPVDFSALYNNDCSGYPIQTHIGDEIILKAGTYKIAINTNDPEYGVINFLDVGYSEIKRNPAPAAQSNNGNKELYVDVIGGKYSTNATPLKGNLGHLRSLKLTHAVSWKGQAQRYGNYAFTVGSDSSLAFHAGATGSSWVGMYQNGTLVASKWTAANTHGFIDVPAGTYTMFVNKSGDDEGTVDIFIK